MILTIFHVIYENFGILSENMSFVDFTKKKMSLRIFKIYEYEA